MGGCSREAVSKALQSMRDLGWVETGRRSIAVLDIAALRQRAREPPDLAAAIESAPWPKWC